MENQYDVLVEKIIQLEHEITELKHRRDEVGQKITKLMERIEEIDYMTAELGRIIYSLQVQEDANKAAITMLMN